MNDVIRYSGMLDKAERDEFTTFARELADVSAAVIRPYFRTGYQVEIKADASPVTIADRRAEEVMRELIMARYPAHGILGEEFGSHQPDARYRWVLDPIDGTKAFVTGTYLFGTLIALVKDGRPALGVISQPIIGDFLLGTLDGAWLNGLPVSVSPCDRVEDAILLSTEHWNVFNHQDGPAYESLTRRVKRYNNWGDCHGYHLVATGGAHIMMDPIMNEWDLMALIPIIEGAGGRITDWQGSDPVGSLSSVATNGVLHDEVIRALNGIS
ncbi:MAG: histidinol-phosphatase [Caldilinea sp.]|nr:histidinol-phosphatase [Caldilinea sp.]MCB0135054.1 histidinol-phosphatase [Caldilineaceae bacterium]MCB9114640.1 histidinol-phosphatase [Caldilineaceae bacterium]MCB9120246.1 histidinol-phosphatase [Caldilineaceae bacterium]MCB9124078.1 histidinol-phosphatase [Caldilineaceae bacterium]